jgi:hypothetical protein
MFPHCESVQFIGKETSTGAVGTFSSLEQNMIIFPPLMWLPGLFFCYMEAPKIVETFRAVFKAIFTCCGVSKFDDSLSWADSMESGRSVFKDTIPLAAGSSNVIELKAVQKTIYANPPQISKLAKCKADCIANKRDCVQGYKSVSELAAVYPKYSGGCGCDQCGKVLGDDALLHCGVHEIDLCLSCALGQDPQKIEACKAGCIANQRAYVKGYDNLAALAAAHPQYASGGSCDKCLKSLGDEQIIHCNVHSMDFCPSCAFSQDGQKIAECKADCIANERMHAKSYANLAALAAVHPEYAGGGGCDGCATLMGNGRFVHCEVHHLDLCVKCAYSKVEEKGKGAVVNTANPLSGFDLELE